MTIINKNTMVSSTSFNRQSMSSPIHLTIIFTKICLILALIVASISILTLANHTYKNQFQQDFLLSSLEEDKGNTSIDKTAMKAEEVQMELPYGSGSDHKSLSYYHCGQKFDTSTITPKDTEIVLLHGAKFTKEDWVDSDILQKLCLKGNENPSEYGKMSIVALDLSVRADHNGLFSAFNALTEGKVLSGKPVVIVTPSASGKSIVSMLPMGESEKEIAKSMLKIWMPVASSSVLGVKDTEAFKSFQELGISILAMNGDGDHMGRQVTKKLVENADAKGVEMKGGHPCYLDSPDFFIDTILSFLRGSESDSSR